MDHLRPHLLTSRFTTQSAGSRQVWIPSRSGSSASGRSASPFRSRERSRARSTYRIAPPRKRTGPMTASARRPPAPCCRPATQQQCQARRRRKRITSVAASRPRALSTTESPRRRPANGAQDRDRTESPRAPARDTGQREPRKKAAGTTPTSLRRAIHERSEPSSAAAQELRGVQGECEARREDERRRRRLLPSQRRLVAPAT
jgi:hypothetical protein